MMRPRVAASLLVACLAAVPPMARAAVPVPEIQRPPATAQAVGSVHTLRQIPEACARLEGAFTGDAAAPYRFAVVRTSPQCQPRARFVDFDKAKPSPAAGWKFNDLIRVPQAGCPARQAVVQVWRKPANVAPPKLDGQGQARIYLQDAKQQAGAGAIPQVALFAARMQVEGPPCR